MVICLELGADLHMAQLMPLLSLSLVSVKSRLGLPFWYRLTRVVPEKGPLNGCVCVCVYAEYSLYFAMAWEVPPKLHLSLRVLGPHLIRGFLHLPVRVHTPNGVSIGSAILAQLMVVSNWHTDYTTPIAIVRIFALRRCNVA